MTSKCAYFWNHVCVSSEMKLQPCCRFDLETLPDHVSNSTLENTDLSLNRTLYQEYREKALAGEKNPGCKKCYDQENIGLKSLRLVVNEAYQDSENERLKSRAGPIRNVELFLGNKCNLKCVMCNPDYSSKWVDDYKLMGFEIKESSKNQKMNNFESFLSKLDHLNELKLLGGEPFLYPSHLSLLKSIEKERREKIKISYFTNVTIFPSKEIQELWGDFRSVEINLSLDSVGRLNDFLRFPSRWNEIESNAKKIISLSRLNKNIVVNVHATVTNISAFYIHELVDWFSEQKKLFPNSGLESLVMVPLVVPSFLSLSNVTNQARTFLSEYFSKHQDLLFLKDWMENNMGSDFDDQLITYLNSLQKIRGIQLNRIMPEFEAFFMIQKPKDAK